MIISVHNDSEKEDDDPDIFTTDFREALLDFLERKMEEEMVNDNAATTVLEVVKEKTADYKQQRDEDLDTFLINLLRRLDGEDAVFSGVLREWLNIHEDPNNYTDYSLEEWTEELEITH